MKEYNYFISYSHVINNLSFFGNCEIKRNAPIKDWTETIEIAQQLTEEFKLNQVVILFFTLMDEIEVD